MKEILNGYTTRQIDAMKDALWYIDANDISLSDALAALKEESEQLHRKVGEEKLQARLEHAAMLPKDKAERRRVFREAEKYRQSVLKVIGLCGCGGTIKGLPVSACETKRSDRVFYKECDTCDYWCEVIEVEKDKYIENSEIGG